MIMIPVLLGLLLIASGLLFLQRKLESYIKTFKPETLVGVTTRANFIGEQLKGGIRGNGAFVLTRDAAHVIRALPFKEYVIPLTAITDVSLTSSFNGKTVFAELLCIHYQTDAGPDAIAIAIRKPEAWKAAIEGVIT